MIPPTGSLAQRAHGRRGDFGARWRHPEPRPVVGWFHVCLGELGAVVVLPPSGWATAPNEFGLVAIAAVPPPWRASGCVAVFGSKPEVKQLAGLERSSSIGLTLVAFGLCRWLLSGGSVSGKASTSPDT